MSEGSIARLINSLNEAKHAIYHVLQSPLSLSDLQNAQASGLDIRALDMMLDGLSKMTEGLMAEYGGTDA